jgi:hypothetical protein
MIPLASDLLPFPGQMRREGHLKSASLPTDFLHLAALGIVGTISQKCPEALTAPVDKITQQFCGFIPKRAKTGAAPRAQVGCTPGVATTRLAGCTTCIGI